jgi:hypothetical protein
MELFNEIILPQETMQAKFGTTFAGHIHEKAVLSPSVVMTGNIFTNEMGEHGKSIWVYELDDETKQHTIEEVKLPVRGIYKVVWEELTEKDDIPHNSIVKCYVTSRETDLSIVRTMLSMFDASIIVEQYPNERAKVHFEDGGLDISVESMLEKYAVAKGLSYEDIKSGFDLIKI